MDVLQRYLTASVMNRMCNYCKVSVQSPEKGWSCHSRRDEEMCVCVCVCVCRIMSVYM